MVKRFQTYYRIRNTERTVMGSNGGREEKGGRISPPFHRAETDREGPSPSPARVGLGGGVVNHTLEEKCANRLKGENASFGSGGGRG